MPRKIEKSLLLEMKLCSALHLLEEKKEVNAQLRLENIALTRALIAHDLVGIRTKRKELQDKLDGFAAVLAQEYGIADDKDIDWETGEIAAPEAQTQGGTGGAGGGDSPAATDAPGAQAPDADGAAGP